jgi:hypothetical protein
VLKVTNSAHSFFLNFASRNFLKRAAKAFRKTAPFRYPQYHTREDLPDKIDFQKLGQVVEGIIAVTHDLAD